MILMYVTVVISLQYMYALCQNLAIQVLLFVICRQIF